MPTNKDIEFLQFHWDDDPMKLLFASHRYADIDIAWVAQQLEGRKQALAKWPLLASNPQIFYPPKLNREQSSSSALAQYKAEQLLLNKHSKVADLTGGMGIDSYYLSLVAGHVDYIELNPTLVETTQHNFEVLKATNITCHCAESMQWISQQGHFDLIYIDPARRDANGKKVSAFESCEPDVLANLSLLLDHCDRLAIKASPMISIPEAVNQLGNVSQIHIVAYKGECKEVIFILSDNHQQLVTCANLESQQPTLTFTQTEELECENTTSYSTHLQKYLYEPNAAIMKSGFYKSIAQRYSLDKLARNTHLYTSNTLIESFPGRVFEVLQEVKLNTKELYRLLPDRRAHVVSRNHPEAAPALQQRLKIKEGGDLFVIATTLGEKPIALLAKRSY